MPPFCGRSGSLGVQVNEQNFSVPLSQNSRKVHCRCGLSGPFLLVHDSYGPITPLLSYVVWETFDGYRVCSNLLNSIKRNFPLC